jgi:hypothetical protein
VEPHLYTPVILAVVFMATYTASPTPATPFPYPPCGRRDGDCEECQAGQASTNVMICAYNPKARPAVTQSVLDRLKDCIQTYITRFRVASRAARQSELEQIAAQSTLSDRELSEHPEYLDYVGRNSA